MLYIAPDPDATLRDFFATHALCGLLASKAAQNPYDFAKAAYILADAMLKERPKATTPLTTNAKGT